MRKRLLSMLALYLIFYSCNGDPGLFSYTVKYIYVTDARFNGKLGGVSGADDKCNNKWDANHPGTGTYKALLADGTSRIASVTANAGDGQNDWVFVSNNDYYRFDDKKFIFTANSKDLFSFGTFDNPFNSDLSGEFYWSGINASGGWVTASDCNNWTESTSGTGAYGEVNKTSANAIGVGAADSCNNTHHLVCVEQ